MREIEPSNTRLAKLEKDFDRVKQLVRSIMRCRGRRNMLESSLLLSIRVVDLLALIGLVEVLSLVPLQYVFSYCHYYLNCSSFKPSVTGGSIDFING